MFKKALEKKENWKKKKKIGISTVGSAAERSPEMLLL